MRARTRDIDYICTVHLSDKEERKERKGKKKDVQEENGKFSPARIFGGIFPKGSPHHN
jgi:hypothetical protein